MARKVVKQGAVHFEGKVIYDKESLFRLFRAKDNVYHLRRILMRFIGGAFIAVIGALAPFPMIVKVIMMMLGCWLVASRDFSARMQVDTTLEKRKAVLPEMKTSFHEETIYLEGEGSMNLSYGKVDRLFYDPEYFYIFFSQDSACMLTRESLKPEDADAFLKFIAKKTGKEWQEYKSFVQMNLSDIKIAFSKH